MLGQTKKSASIRKSAKLPKLNIQQHIENQQIADRMNRKVTFARNPRHLTQTMTYASALASQGGESTFRVQPQQLFFSNYDTMHLYESQVRLVNISRYIQRIKILPLKQKEFMLANIKYPKEDSGDIAPGMAVTIHVRFRPASLNDCGDQLVVIAGQGVVKVPIVAQRERCQITWPKSISCGHCWVGDVIKKEIVLKNKGGQAQFSILNSNPEATSYKINNFTITPSTIDFEKNSTKVIVVQFLPQQQGVFKENIRFKSYEGDQQQVEIVIEGGAYSAQIVLEEIKQQKLLQHRMHNITYLQNTELGKISQASLKVRNLAVVHVDYFWHFTSKSLSIAKAQGKMKPSQLLPFSISYNPQERQPQTVKLDLYLFNLPEKSLAGNVVSTRINGIDAIQCISIEIRTRPAYSNIEVFPIHRQIVQPIYQNIPVVQTITLKNYSSVRRSFKIQRVKQDDGVVADALESEGLLEPNSEKSVSLKFHLSSLTRSLKKAYFMVSFDNSPSKIVSLEGKSTYPELVFKEEIIYFGLCKTYTLNKKKLAFKNPQKTPILFKILNQNRFYELDFYQFYEFQDEQSYKRRFNIYDPLTGNQILDWIQIPPQKQLDLDCYLNVLNQQSIDMDIQLQVKHGQKTILKILAEVQQVKVNISRPTINLRQIYKGNIYNSNKFLSRELQLVNDGNIDCAFEITQPAFQECEIRIEPLTGLIKKKSTQRLDLILQPIKTGDFDIKIQWKYYDDFKANPSHYQQLSQKIRFNAVQGQSSMYKHQSLQLLGMIKGMAMNYYIKDESRVKKIRQKIEDLPQSVKLSASSFTASMKSSKNLLENEKLVYPILQELNFYNCEINQVKQVEIIIENDSGLTTEYEIYAQNYHTLEKIGENQKKFHKGLVKVEEEAFTSQMGKTFIRSKALDRSQKVHLGNNKGISILCEPSKGILHKKQNQKILITMFNDTSGRFKDFLAINVKNHQIKKIPIDIHIKGTPVSLSRNQLGIDFNQQIPFMNLGTLLHSNGLTKRSIKVVNNGPKEVQLKWLIYPYNKSKNQNDIFNIEFHDAAPGTGQLVQLKWNAIRPEEDKQSVFKIQPKQRKIKGRQQVSFTVLIQDIQKVQQFSNLLICEPALVDGEHKTSMESLAVAVSVQTINPYLTMDVKHKNHLNKLQKFAVDHNQYQTNSKNNIRKLKLKNLLKANLTFDIQIINKDQKSAFFKLLQAKTNSPATNIVANTQKSFCLIYDSIVELSIQLTANSSNLSQWPLQQKIRKEGSVVISYCNGTKQVIDLVGWLYRPWVLLQMPNHKYYSSQNFEIDFGTIHYKNSKKLSVFLLNPSKVDAKYTITYIKYQQSIKYKFQQSLWTSLDYQDQTITDEKKCWRLSLDGGTIKNKTIPVHYMPGTLALPSQDDHFAQTHKPVELVIMFKPQANVLYKSKYRIAIAEGQTIDFVVKGRGTFDEQMEKK